MMDRSDLVTTGKTARAIIEDIARRKGTFTRAFIREANNEAEAGRLGMLQVIESGVENREDFSKLLKLISRDLYTSEARFLMEVIQNADDNKYVKGRTPTVSITVFPKYVKIECNEQGFSEENVRALCRTGHSSKPPGQGYTGEKGIGFKSVFKLANRVHIRSEPYYFQLDQRRDLGMITPQWDEDFFDDHAEEHQTTIILDHICNGSKDFSGSLQEDVDGIDPVLLIFLRRIERLHLTLFLHASDVKPVIRKRFRRVDFPAVSGIVSLEDEDKNTLYHYYKQQFTTQFNGMEPRRPNVTETDVVLAFPVTKGSSHHSPLIRKSNLAFAWLPLVDTGFKFVIQADFLTTSNRQSVDEDNDWNKTIAEAIPHAFEAAIKEFNKGSRGLGLTRTWPLYLNPDTRGLSPYWRTIGKRINEHLSGTFTIKDRTGHVRRPKDLMFLDWACDRDGDPMFGSKSDYISRHYPDTVREAISWLGVTTPDWDWVCNELKDLHNKGVLVNKMQSTAWCSDLASVILKSVQPNDRKYARDLKEIPLIPLSNGEWRCAPSKESPIYFPASLGATIPPGLPLSLVEERASACPTRKKLFRLLGVKDCDVSSVVERILAYHTKLKSAQVGEIIAQLRYLYKMREHLQLGDMHKICFACSSPKSRLLKGTSIYVDFSSGGELKQLFSGCSKISFLHKDYFVDLDATERAALAEWLHQTAGMALVPRFIKTSSHELHADFEWLLANKSEEVLAILRQHWSVYGNIITHEAKETLANHEFPCWSGSVIALQETRIPSARLLNKARTFCKARRCNFLTLPNGEPEDWEFLSNLGVALDDELPFYLWVLSQPGYQDHKDADKSKKLYLEIQSRAFSPCQEQSVREAFGETLITLEDGECEDLSVCVWDAPKGFLSEPVLCALYGAELEPLFRDILEVPNLTSAKACGYLEELQEDDSTVMADVIDVYLYLQDHYLDDCCFDEDVACVAIPSPSEPSLNWKTPAQCVWDDAEFSQNGIELKSKIALRPIVKQHMLAAKAFFTKILKLPNAGIEELLADLALMQGTSSRRNSKRIHRLYERIESCRRTYSRRIKHAFEASPLIFLKGYENERDQWVALEDCVWTRSVLRSKHSLKPSLNHYQGLFQDTLEVPDATRDMLLSELLDRIGDEEDEHEYAKELLQKIAHPPYEDDDLKRLEYQSCWPCRNPEGTLEFCGIEEFYVNDRQDLYEMFADSVTLLDCCFDTSKRLGDLLRNQGATFLSKSVSIDTECHEPLKHDPHLTADFRGRADYLVTYFEHIGSKSPYELKPLLENAEVWTSADIRTHYVLGNVMVTKSEGGSSATVCTDEDEDEDEKVKLKIYVSTDEQMREHALLTDFPTQLLAALKLEPTKFPDLTLLLHVPLTSLRILMIKKGFTSGNNVDDNQVMPRSVLSHDDDQDEMRERATSLLRADSAEHVVVQSTSISARSETTLTALQPNVRSGPSVRPTTPESRAGGYLNVPIAGPYSADNRDRNMAQLRRFARHVGRTSISPLSRSNSQSRNSDSVFQMSALSRALNTAELAPIPDSVQVNSSSPRRGGPDPNRNDEQKKRDFEVGFLGELFVYHMLQDTLELPDFTAEENWTSSLRSRAGFSKYGREVSDFTYKDTQGALTRHLLQMPHHYAVPEWLASACSNGNVPLYRLEVKSTTSQAHNTPFYMSGAQYRLAETLQVTTGAPSEIYVILRISGLNALEDDTQDRPQMRVYLDPYTCGAENVLRFAAPTYVVTPTA